MTEDRHPAFTYPDDPQGKPAPYVKGSLESEARDLIEALEGDRDNWRRIAVQKDVQLVRLLAQVGQLQAELRHVLGAAKVEEAEHDRS
jgi:hypothetical protein